MPRGASDIPILRLEVLQGLTETWTQPPNLVLSNMFPTTPVASDTITWESYEGSRGLAPFYPPDSVTPSKSVLGYAQHSAKAALFGEKVVFGEGILNNLRQPGTWDTYETAESQVARSVNDIRNDVLRRKEWSLAQALTSGSLTYYTDGGVQLYVDYGIPTAQNVTLAAAAKWSTGGSRDILGDLTTMRQTIQNATGGRVTDCFLNSTTLNYMVTDDRIVNLLQTSTFGNGNLFKADSAGYLVGASVMVLESLLNIGRLHVYDEQYQIRGYLVGNVAAGATTLVVDNVEDFVDGATIKIWDQSAGTYESATISSISQATSTITVSAAITGSYIDYSDYITMTKYFIPDNKFIGISSNVGGKAIMEFMQSPFGIPRVNGVSVDQWEEKDPESVSVRCRLKGLPVLKQRDAVYIITVA